MKRLIGGISAIFAVSFAQGHTLSENVRLALDHVHLTSVTLGTEHSKNVEITGGQAGIIWPCLTDPVNWKVGSRLDKIAHKRADDIISCRQRRSPSLHAIFELKDRQLYPDTIHLDGHGPDSPMKHVEEFLFHKILLRDNDQNRMYRNLQRSFAAEAPADTYHRFDLYAEQAFGPGAMFDSLAGAVAGHYWNHLIWSNRSARPVPDRLCFGLARHASRSLMEYTFTKALHEDTRYRPSGEHGLLRRAGYVWYHTVMAKTDYGYEPAYGMFAAVGGTAVVTSVWHPWTPYPVSPLRQAAAGISLKFITNAFKEILPDIWNKF